jgi:hypothetical protein
MFLKIFFNFKLLNTYKGIKIIIVKKFQKDEINNHSNKTIMKMIANLHQKL